MIKKKNQNYLKYWINRFGITQKDLADALKVPTQTVNSWCKGVCIPRMDRVQKLADYFHIGKSDLLEPKSGATLESIDSAMHTLLNNRENSINKSSVEQFLITLGDANIQLLIEVASRSKPEDVQMAIELLERLNLRGL